MAKGNPNPSPDTRFSSTRQPTKRRTPSKLKKYIKDTDITPADVAAIIKNIIFIHDQGKLEQLMLDKAQPMIIRMFIKAYLSDFKKGSLNNFEILMCRAFGKPDQPISGDLNVNYSEMTKEERSAAIARLLEKRGSDNEND